MKRLPLLLTAALALALGGCAGLDRFDRSYSLNVSDGKQSIGVGVTLRPR